MSKKQIKKQGVLIKEEVGYQAQFEIKNKGDNKKNNGKKEKK